MKRTWLVVVVLAAQWGFAHMKRGENILVNGTLEAEQVDFPPYWEGNRKVFKWHPDGGPRGIPYISVHSKGIGSSGSRLRQNGLNLVSNGLYRASMWVRTKNFTCASHTGLIIVNCGMWGPTAGLFTLPGKFAFPRDTGGEWQRCFADFHLFGSPTGYYAMLHVDGQEGELDVTNLRIEALDDLALSQSRPSELLVLPRRPRLVPCGSLLAKIPANDPVARFRFYGELEGSDAAYDVVLATPERGLVSRVALSRNEMALALPAGVTAGSFTASVVRRGEEDAAKSAFAQTYNFAIRPPLPAPLRPARRLNNLVAEVLSAEVTADHPADFAFDLARDGWAFIGVTGETGAHFVARLDGADALSAATPRHETFRKLRAGRHALSVAGLAHGRVIVRAIAEILNYCPGVNSALKENPPYDWAYQERYGLPAVTTELGGAVAPSNILFRARGYQHFANMNLVGMPAEKMRAQLRTCPGLAAPQYDGVACDEQAMSDLPSIELYTRGFWQFDAAEHPTRPIYTWAYGKMSKLPTLLDFLAACINVSHGEGKLLREIYCRSAADEAGAHAWIDKYVLGTFRDFRAANPDCMPSMGLVYGNFNQVPILSINHHPEVDYKYYLDMQMNYAANDPALKDIGLIGYWGSYYADDELHRWSMRLLRHYAVEGHTNMLSAAYGFAYNPNHVRNGDFRGTFAPWRTSGNVRLDAHAGFGSKAQNRWGGNDGVGDTFAVLVREEGAPATLRQTLAHLVPGRRYCLQFATFDVRDVKANRIAPRRFAIQATLGPGAVIDPRLSWTHVDTRIKGRYAINNGVARINLQHIVFTAQAPEIALTLDNAAAKPGEELGVNYLSVNPYYME